MILQFGIGRMGKAKRILPWSFVVKMVAITNKSIFDMNTKLPFLNTF